MTSSNEILQTLHGKLTQAHPKFRDGVLETCGFSQPSYYRRIRSKATEYIDLNSELDIIEKKLIIEQGIIIANDIIDYLNMISKETNYQEIKRPRKLKKLLSPGEKKKLTK